MAGSFDIVKARELFIRFEQTQDHKPRLAYFSDAIDLLDPYLKEDSDDGRQARNLQKAHTRKLLSELPSLAAGKLEIDDWGHYRQLLTGKLETITQAACAEDPNLRRNLDDFTDLYRRDALEVFREMGYLKGDGHMVKL